MYIIFLAQRGSTVLCTSTYVYIITIIMQYLLSLFEEFHCYTSGLGIRREMVCGESFDVSTPHVQW